MNSNGVGRRSRTFLGALVLAIPLIGLAAVFFFLDIRHEVNNQKSSIYSSEQLTVSIVNKGITNRLRFIGNNVKCLSEMQSMSRFLDSWSESDKSGLQKDFLAFSRNRGEYDQIRVLDMEGNEVVRINYNDGSPAIVPVHLLQRKSHRYYVAETMNLERGGMYISPLDLNIENKKIEIPLKPMIRYGMPLYNSKGIKKGVLIVNYLAAHLISDFSDIEKKGLGKISLLNDRGYWLHGEFRDGEWGFMYPERKDMTFGNAHKRDWELITRKKVGHFERDGNVFSFAYINVLDATVKEWRGKSVSGEDGWYVISRVPSDIVWGQIEHIYHTSLISFVAIAICILGLSFTFVSHQIKLKNQEKEEVEKRSADEWKTTFNSFNDPIAIVDRERVIRISNRAFVARFGGNKQGNCNELFRSFGNMEDICKSCNVFAEGEFSQKEIYDDMEGRWYDFIATPIRDDKGDVVEVIHSFRDITEKKNSAKELINRERLLRRAQQIGKMGNWTLDFASGKLEWSDEIYNILEMDKDEFDASYEKFLDIVHPDDREYVNGKWKKAIRHEEVYDLTHRILLKDNREKVVRELAEIKFNDENRAVSAEGILQDITEQQELADQLRQSDKMQAIGQLAGGIAHDFNNQLSAILGYSGMIIKKTDDDSLKRYAGNILKAGERASDLTKQLLAFSRKGPKRNLFINLHDLIQEVIALLDRSIDKQIVIITQLDSKNPIIEGDPSLMQNAILNLCINARDAMSAPGTITITTSDVQIDQYMQSKVTTELKEGAHILLSISDTGSGIPKHLQKKIFEPFFTTKAEGKGTGMGLAAVFGTVKQHYGCIRLYSEVNVGTKFNIYLPNSSKGKASDAEREIITPVYGTGTIMIVDDEDLIREMACDILADFGYETIPAEGPTEALRVFQQRHAEIDLVILDLIMPGGSGRDIYYDLVEVDKDIRVLIASGFSANNEVQELLDAGAKGFLPKPFTPVMLSNVVAEILRGNE